MEEEHIDLHDILKKGFVKTFLDGLQFRHSIEVQVGAGAHWGGEDIRVWWVNIVMALHGGSYGRMLESGWVFGVAVAQRGAIVARCADFPLSLVMICERTVVGGGPGAALYGGRGFCISPFNSRPIRWHLAAIFLRASSLSVTTKPTSSKGLNRP
jgi:hypothetical protein